ncbi:MAG TPA: AI-2E family transporter [Nitrospira sp.]|nr:AI-2E family transporter [Nitrospira sp.]
MRRQNGRKGPHLWDIQAVVDVFVLLMFAATAGLLYALRGIFVPLLVALGLAYLFNPLITSLEKRWHMPRPFSISALLACFTVAAAGFIAWLGPLLVQQAQTLAKKAPAYIETLGARYGIELTGISEQVGSWTTWFQENPLAAVQPVFTGTSQALGFISTVIGTTSYIAMTAILMPIYFFMFAWGFERMTGFFRRLIPVSRRPRILDVLGKLDEAVFGFFRGRLLVALITGIMYAAGWALTQVPYWFLLGSITGLLTVIPYVSVIGWPLAVLLKYLDTVGGGQGAEWFAILVLPSLPYLVVQFIESWWLTPWIQGRTNDLSAVTVIVVVLVGGAIAGLLGMLVAIPVASITKILFQEFVLPEWEAWAQSK